MPSSRNRGALSGSGPRPFPWEPASLLWVEPAIVDVPLGSEEALEDLAGHIDHPGAGPHGRLLDEPEGLGLGHSGPLHQHGLGPVDQATGLELVLGAHRPPGTVLRCRLASLGVDGPLLLT